MAVRGQLVKGFRMRADSFTDQAVMVKRIGVPRTSDGERIVAKMRHRADAQAVANRKLADRVSTFSTVDPEKFTDDLANAGGTVFGQLPLDVLAPQQGSMDRVMQKRRTCQIWFRAEMESGSARAG